MYKNSEGYSDPTAGEAIKNIKAQERAKERYEALDMVIKIMRTTAELAGFEIAERVVLRDKKTGREYR